MSTWAVLATGQSLTPAQLALVRKSGTPAVAVSDAYLVAPWADAMVSQDRAWWQRYPDAHRFAGRKFSTRQIEGVEKVAVGPLTTGSNSGLLAVHVARLLGATKVLLLGVDLRGTHYFGPHPKGLKNTPPDRFRAMRGQFERYPRGDLVIINCSPGSSLKCFPMDQLEAAL